MYARALLLVFIVPFILLLYTSCGECSQKVDCPGFTDTTLTAWFPYQRSDRLIFESGQNLRDTFTIQRDTLSGPYQDFVRTGSTPACYSSRTLLSAERDSFQNYRFLLELLVRRYGQEVKSASMFLRQTAISFEELGEDGFAAIHIRRRGAKVETFPQLTIGSRLYNNVHIATRDTSVDKTAGVYKIIFAKGAGLVGYSDYPSLRTWVKL